MQLSVSTAGGVTTGYANAADGVWLSKTDDQGGATPLTTGYFGITEIRNYSGTDNGTAAEQLSAAQSAP